MRRLQRFGGEVDVAVVTARQRGDDRAVDGVGDLLDAAQIALRGGGEAGFDDVHAERVELPGEAQFGFRCHRIAGCLFAVAQRGIEDDDILSHGFPLTAVKKKDREPD